MEKTISVIIPIFNQQRFVERCLRSILNQTLSKTIYDIIVIDDGSTDNTKKILENYKDKIKILSNKKNLGLPYSLNKGIKASQAQYIVRLDSDDYVNENFLLFLSTFLDMNKVIGAVSCDYMLVDDNEEILSRKNSKNYPIACGIMFRRDCLIDIGLYDEKFLLMEEQDLRIRFLNKYKIANIEIPLYRYRRHDRNITSNRTNMKKYNNLLKMKHGIKND
ncbi:glycosyltransferase family 2 protein [bacterium]|nr:glycosyltransferase family 2 protein [bacterium]